MNLFRVLCRVFFFVGISIFSQSFRLVKSQSTSCYEISNGQRFLRPSSAVDPNRNYWRFAELTLNGTVETPWKLLPTLNSCFRLCNPETGLYLMVAENDFTYAVARDLMQQQPREAFIFGPYYPQWPNSLDALITSTLKLHQLCVFLDDDPNEDKLIVTYPQQTASAHPTQCRWQLRTVACPRSDLC
ncbi:hypothetical protein ZHAS_00006626 [Anopheles sinensis]|uniref:Uncharacterized protein n=1 Tax=Anopheles sinensis TaxID=74873 RepID=A0A084VMT1_ANOSI|nr:hypothetical protein ZHAS_00006626 [Anopheles sinensis]